MPRLAPRTAPYEPALADALAAMMPPGVEPIAFFRTVAHSPRILEKLRAGNLLDRGGITRRERELVILRTTARCGAEYEWGVHVAFFGARVGLAADVVAATATAAAHDPVWSAHDALLIRLSDALHDAATVDDDLWAALARAWTAEQLIELIAVAGFYHTVSCLVNALQIDLEPGAPRFPGGTAAAAATGALTSSRRRRSSRSDRGR